MAYLDQFTTLDGTTYDLADSAARKDIASLKETTKGGVHYRGVTTTELHDGGTDNAITLSTGDAYTAAEGDEVSYDNKMFAWNGKQWDLLGSDSDLKALAYKDSVSGSTTPTGKVSAPAFTGTKATISVSGTPSGSVGISAAAPASGETANYTPTGSVSVIPNTTTVKQLASAGTLPSLITKVDGTRLILSFSQGALPTSSNVTVATGVKSASFAGNGTTIKGSFTGNAMNSSGSYTPAGTNSVPTFTGNAATIQSK